MRLGQIIKQVGVQNFEPLPVLWFDISPLDVELESVEVLRLGLAIRTPNRRWMDSVAEQEHEVVG